MAVSFPETISAVWRAMSARIDRLDARFLIEHQLRISQVSLIARPETPVSGSDWVVLDALASRRAAGEPLAYLIGWVEFCGLRLEVTPAVLVPRPETGELVAHALSLIEGLSAPTVLDLGTGSGAIALAIAASRRDAKLFAVDVSASALKVAQRNADAHRLDVCFYESDWFTKLPPLVPVDLIVANPPYVAAGDPHLDGDGLRFEPKLALTDGADGLACLRSIIQDAPDWLAAGGWLYCEHGFDQAEACRVLLTARGFTEVASRQDLGGQARMTGGRWGGPQATSV